MKKLCYLGHLLDLRCCDLVKIQLNPEAGFPINLRSLSRHYLSDLYRSSQPTGNGDDLHHIGLDSVLFLACTASSSAKKFCNSIDSLNLEQRSQAGRAFFSLSCILWGDLGMLHFWDFEKKKVIWEGIFIHSMCVCVWGGVYKASV